MVYAFVCICNAFITQIHYVLPWYNQNKSKFKIAMIAWLTFNFFSAKKGNAQY